MLNVNHVSSWYFQAADVRKKNAPGTGSDYVRRLTASERKSLTAWWDANRWVIDPGLPPLLSQSCASSPSGWMDGYAAYIKGSADDNPQYELVIPPLKDGKGNDNFCARQRSGEIVISPYVRRDVSFSFENGVSVHNSKALNQHCQVNLEKNSDKLPWSYISSGRFKGWLDMGNGYLCAVTFSMGRSISDIKYDVSPFAYGLTLQNLEDAFTPVITAPVDPAWVQEVHANANSRCVDWLTTVMEFPETLKAVFGAMRGLGSALKNWKNREKTIRQQWSQYVARLKKQIAETTDLISKAKPGTIYRKLRRKLKKLNKAYSRKGKKLIDMLTSGWMTYRYGVMPYVYLIKDVLYAAEKDLVKRQYLTVRDKKILDVDAPSLPGYSFNGEATCEVKMMIKYGYEPYLAKLSDLTRVASANVALTAWELASRSFVWDWFLTVGDALSAGFGKPADATQMATTLSYRTTIKGVYVHNISGAKVHVDYSAYSRSIPDLGSFRGIYFRPNLTLKRMVDAFSMLWPTLKKGIK